MKRLVCLSVRVPRIGPPTYLFAHVTRPALVPFHQRRQPSRGFVQSAHVKMKLKDGGDLKVPKGTKDWHGEDMRTREHLFHTITEVFKRHGGVPLDTLVTCIH